MHSPWQTVSLVTSKRLSRDIKMLQFKGSALETHIPGQFYIVQIVASDGSVASREYSLANTPNKNNIIEFGVQEIVGGAVSPQLVRLKKGETIQVKGPLGKYFNWDKKQEGPVVFIAGGAGVVPFMSIIRTNPKNEIVLIGSFKTITDIPYMDELKRIENTNNKFKQIITVTKEDRASWIGQRGRIDLQLLSKMKDVFSKNNVQIFICGRSSFVEDMNTLLLSLNVEQEKIQRERFR